MIKFIKSGLDKVAFELKVADGTVDKDSIVFLKNLNKIWSDDVFYDCGSDTVLDNLNSHVNDKSNPHSVTKTQVGLSNVDNTSDIDKPVSTALASAISDAKKAGTDALSNLNTHIADKTNPHEVTKTQVGLGNVDNESKTTMFTNPKFTGTPIAPTAEINTNTTQIATTEFVQSAIDTKLAANDAMLFKGTLGVGGTITELPSIHNAGWAYKVITAGIYAGESCEIGDLIICITDGTAANNTHWTVVQTNIDGAVVGSSVSTNNAVAVFNGISGKVIKNSGVIINDDNLTAAKIIKKDGTSNQFLKADGSVDNNNYLTVNNAQSTYVKKSGDNLTGELTISGNKVWHAGNDGANSGLDADTLDGKHNGEVDAATLVNKQVSFEGLNSLSGTLAFSGQDGELLPGCDWNGILIGDNAQRLQIISGVDSRLYVRTHDEQPNKGWENWMPIAFTSDNVASASKLLTARTLTIGGTGKTFDGTTNIAWTLAEIGAAAANHTHNYLPLTGGTINTNPLTIDAVNSNNSDLLRLQTRESGKGIKFLASDNTFRASIVHLENFGPLEISAYNNIRLSPHTAGQNEGTVEVKGSLLAGSIKKTGGTSAQFLKADGSVDGNSYSLSNHTHSYLPLTGGTVTGPIEIKSSVSNNYNEGLRITRGSNNWAGITFGSTGLSGAPTNGWVAATNPDKQFIISPDTSTNTIGLTLNKNGNALWKNEIIATLNWVNAQGFLKYHQSLANYMYSFGGVDCDPTAHDGNYVGMTTKSGIDGSWWNIISLNWVAGNNVGNKSWVSQLALPTQTRKSLRYRTGTSASAYSGWVTVLDTSNSGISDNTITINGVSIAPLIAHLSLANYYTKTETDNRYQPKGNYLTGITKALVEAVLTGNVTSHSHSQYLTAHQSLASYVPFSKQSKATINNTNLNPQFLNVENENLVANFKNHWSLINLGSYSGGNFRSQIAIPYQAGVTNELFIRTANMSTWNDWNRVLHDGNYTSYLTWDNLQGKPSLFIPISHTHTWASIADKPSTFTPATHSHNYNDLTNKPTIGNGTITITLGGTTKGSFSVNQTGNTTIALDAADSSSSGTSFVLPGTTEWNNLENTIINNNLSGGYCKKLLKAEKLYHNRVETENIDSDFGNTYEVTFIVVDSTLYSGEIKYFIVNNLCGTVMFAEATILNYDAVESRWYNTAIINNLLVDDHYFHKYVIYPE